MVRSKPKGGTLHRYGFENVTADDKKFVWGTREALIRNETGTRSANRDEQHKELRPTNSVVALVGRPFRPQDDRDQNRDDTELPLRYIRETLRQTSVVLQQYLTDNISGAPTATIHVMDSGLMVHADVSTDDESDLLEMAVAFACNVLGRLSNDNRDTNILDTAIVIVQGPSIVPYLVDDNAPNSDEIPLTSATQFRSKFVAGLASYLAHQFIRIANSDEILLVLCNDSSSENVRRYGVELLTKVLERPPDELGEDDIRARGSAIYGLFESHISTMWSIVR